MEYYDWAHSQFWTAKLPDLRLNRRLVEVAARIRENPVGCLPRVILDKSGLKGAYRLLSHPDVTHAALLRPHVERTRKACEQPGEYLMVEDTTDLSFSQRDAIDGMGPLTKRGSQGCLAHTCLALRVEHWTEEARPEATLVGLFGQECWARQKPEGTRGDRKKEKRKQKMAGTRISEADRWGRALCGAQKTAPGVMMTLVTDREGDIFGLMVECMGHNNHFLIRAAQARKTAARGESIRDAVAQAPVLGRSSLSLRARPGVAAREATLELRAVQTIVQPPRENPEHYPPQQIGLVEAREVNAPEGVCPLLWVLLTSWPCTSLMQALRVVNAYACRWQIEEYHKALKSGTHIEDSQLSSLHGIEALLAIHAVVAVELLRLKLLCRTCPDAPVAQDVIAPEALTVLEIRTARPTTGWTNDTLLRAIARLGGYLDRNNDGPPGWQTIWRGWHKLIILTEGYMLALGQMKYG